MVYARARIQNYSVAMNSELSNHLSGERRGISTFSPGLVTSSAGLHEGMPSVTEHHLNG